MAPKRQRDDGGDDAGAEADASRRRLSNGSNSSEAAGAPSLRFATESWQGMKPSNEDRHVTDASAARLPGPVFGVFDGHGGVFTVEFLVRHLLKVLSATIKQHVPARETDALVVLQEQIADEARRRRELTAQLEICRARLAEMQQLLAGEGDAVGENPEKSAGDEMCDQLRAASREIEDAVALIDDETAQRRERFAEWVLKHDAALKSAIVEGFQQTDAQVVQKNPSRDGSTALLLWFVFGDRSDPAGAAYYYTANLGDCRAVLCRGSQAIPLTTDHKPNRPDERQRILSAGGFVGTFAGIARVYSAAGAGLSVQEPQQSATYLAVSRAFGDRPLKVPTPLVSCEPEVKRFRVESEDLFIVVACDGIWDVLSNQDAVNIGLQHFASAQSAADAIVKEAYKRGSSDNLTATVVQFGWQDGSSVLTQAQATSSAMAKSVRSNGAHDGQRQATTPRFAQKAFGAAHPRVSTIVDGESSEAAASAAGETTENQDDDDDEEEAGEEEEEIDMFNL